MNLKEGDKIIHLVKHAYAGVGGENKERAKIKCYVGHIESFKTKVVMISLLKDGKYYRKAALPDSIERYTEAAIDQWRLRHGSSFMLLR